MQYLTFRYFLENMLFSTCAVNEVEDNLLTESRHCFPLLFHSKTSQRNKQIAMGRKKFNMDPKKVSLTPKTTAVSCLLRSRGLWKNEWLSELVWVTINSQHWNTAVFELSVLDWDEQTALSCIFFSLGDPVSLGEWPSTAHPRRHLPVPVQGRGPQQDRHRRLLRGAVSRTIYQTAGEIVSPSVLFNPTLRQIYAPLVIRTFPSPREHYGLDLWMEVGESDRYSQNTNRRGNVGVLSMVHQRGHLTGYKKDSQGAEGEKPRGC